MSQLTNKKILAGLLGLILMFSLFAPMQVLGFSETTMAQGPTTDPNDPFDLFPDYDAPSAGTAGAPGAGTAGAPSAGTGLKDTGKVPLNNPLTGSAGAPDIYSVINNIITVLLGLTGALALVAFIYGGVLWMVSSGDTGKVEKGKKMIIWALIGLVVVFSSYAVLTLVFNALGFTGTT